MAFTRAVALDYIQRAHEQDRLGHAYLIAGPSGSGKRGLASDIANLVNDDVSRDIFASRPPEVRIAEPESKSRRILTEQIRELEHALQMRSANGRRKIAVILDADRLQPQAANAFLKTLEEPPSDSLLLLLTRLPEVLPDTIVSRCIAITLSAPEERIALPDEAELVRLLDSSTTDRESGVRAAYRLAQGFQRLLSSVRESIQAENTAALKSEETRYKHTTDGAWLDDREEYFKALTESAYIERRARLLEIIYVWWTDVLRANRAIERCGLPAARESTNAVAKRICTPEILRRIQRIEELRDHLSRNIQEALAIEVAFLRIFAF